MGVRSIWKKLPERSDSSSVKPLMSTVWSSKPCAWMLAIRVPQLPVYVTLTSPVVVDWLAGAL